MKKLLLLFCILQSYSSLNAQTYQPFPTDSASWRCYTSCYMAGGERIYKIDNDTLLNGNLYHKIIRNDGGVSQYYVGALRESAKKIYFCFKDSTIDFLLYDFNVLQGDTIKWYGLDGGRAVVTEIDSIYLFNKYYKRFFIEGIDIGTFDAYVIEGIGSKYGLIDSWGDGPCFNRLECFKKKNQIIYSESLWSNCSDTIIVGINRLNMKRNIKLSPNPVTRISNLDLSSLPAYFKTIEIYNSIGQKVKDEKLDNSSQYQISREEFIPGYYLYKLSNSNDFVTGKFIVQ